MREQWVTGQAVDWKYTPRGGYGYTQRIPATVVEQTKKRVTIAVAKANGDVVFRSVKAESLIPQTNVPGGTPALGGKPKTERGQLPEATGVLSDTERANG